MKIVNFGMSSFFWIFKLYRPFLWIQTLFIIEGMCGTVDGQDAHDRLSSKGPSCVTDGTSPFTWCESGHVTEFKQ